MAAIVEFDIWYPSPEYLSIILCTSGRNDINRALSGGHGIYIDYSGDNVRFMENGTEYLSVSKQDRKKVLEACDCINIAVGANFRRSKEALRRIANNYIFDYGTSITNTPV